MQKGALELGWAFGRSRKEDELTTFLSAPAASPPLNPAPPPKSCLEYLRKGKKEKKEKKKKPKNVRVIGLKWCS